MPKITVLTLPDDAQATLDDAQATLEKAAKHGQTYSFRLRCQAVLLKTDPENKRTSLDVAKQLGCCEMSVNDWIKRYQQQGLTGLKVKPGRGRKPIWTWAQAYPEQRNRSCRRAPRRCGQPPAHQPSQSLAKA